eukprot:m.203062 g.203062  ORF g.203062 m.203062 type:complete len:2039 (+) comp13726_c0_seq8:111-6227(+)
MTQLQFEGVCSGHFALQYFPFSGEIDYEVESNEYLLFVVERMQHCLFSKNINDDLFESLRGINRYCQDVVRFDMSEETFAHLVEGLWSFAFDTEELGTKWLKRILNTLNHLLERSFLFSTDCMELDWRPAYKVYKSMYWIPRRLPPKETSKQRNLLESVLLWARRWFSKESVVEIYEEARPYLCGFDTSLSFGTEFVRHFLPLDLRSRSRSSPQFLHFHNEYMELWPFLTRGNVFHPSIRTLQDLIVAGVGKYDPAPIRKVIIRQLLKKVRDDMRSNVIKYDDPLSFCFVFLCRPNDEQFWTDAKELMHILTPLTHPSMTSTSQVTVFSFVVGCVQALSERRTIESKDMLAYPDEAKLSHDDYERFVMLLKDILFMGLNSKSGAVVGVMSYCSQVVSKLAPRSFLPAVAEEIIPMLQSEENHRVIAMLSLMSSVTYNFFSPTLFPSCDMYLVPLLEGILPAIDANDSVKTTRTFNFLSSVFNTVVFVDCSSHIPDDASEEDVAVLESTAQFEQWCMDFLDAVFRLSEDISGKSLGKVVGACGACLRPFFHQLSPQIRERVIKKTAKWVLSTSNFQASIPSHLCKGAAIADASTTVALLLEPIASKIMEQAELLPSYDDEKAEVVKRDHMLNYYLNLFLHILIVPYPGIIQHTATITRVFSVLFNTRSRKSTTVATDALERFLSSLTTVRLVDKCSVDKDVWAHIESDPVKVFKTRYLSSTASFEEAMDKIWTHTSCEELLNGDLKFHWVAPSEEQLQLAGVLVGMFLEPAQEYIRMCASAKVVDAIDEERMRMSLTIVGRFAECMPVAPFPLTGSNTSSRYFIPKAHSFVVESVPYVSSDSGGLLLEEPMAAMDESEDGDGTTPTPSSSSLLGLTTPSPITSSSTRVNTPSDKTPVPCLSAGARRAAMRDDICALLKWLLQHKQNDMISITRCILTASRVLLGKKPSQGYKSDTSLGRNVQWISPTRSAFAAILDRCYVRRVEKTHTRLIEHSDDDELVTVLVECLQSRYEGVRKGANSVLDKWIMHQRRETGHALIDGVITLWESAPKLKDYDDAKAVILGCMQCLCKKNVLPMLCRSYPRVLRVMRVSTSCLSVSDDQILFDSLNVCVENIINTLTLFVRPSALPKKVLRHTTHALRLVSQGASTEGMEEEIAHAVEEVGAVLREYGNTLVREGQRIILYCLEEFDRVKSSSWKVKMWFARLLTVLLLEKHYLHPQAIHFLMFYMTSGTPQLRAQCRGAIAIILYYLKVRPKKVTVKFEKGGPVVVPDEEGEEEGSDAGELNVDDEGSGDLSMKRAKRTKEEEVEEELFGFGRRADSAWIMPEIKDNAMAAPSKQHIFIDKPYLGWLAWPRTFKTYAPECEQDYSHLTGRHSAPTPTAPGTPVTSVPSTPISPTALARRWSDGMHTFPNTPTTSVGRQPPSNLPSIPDDDVVEKIVLETKKIEIDAKLPMNSYNNNELESSNTCISGIVSGQTSQSHTHDMSVRRKGKPLIEPIDLGMDLVAKEEDIYLDTDVAVSRCRYICEAMLLDEAYLVELITQLASDALALLYSSVSSLIKGFARIYGIELLRPMFAAMEAVPNKNLPRTHSRLSGMVSGLVRGSKHWPSEDRAALWEFLTPFLTEVLGDIPQGALQVWADCFVECVCEHDPRRSHHTTNFLLSINFGHKANQFTAVQRFSNAVLLNSIVSELSWRGHNLSQHVLEQVHKDLNSPYDLVRRGVGRLISTCHVSLYTRKYNNVKLQEFMNILMQPLTVAVNSGAEHLNEIETLRAKVVLSVLLGCSSYYGGEMLLTYLMHHLPVLSVLPEMVQDHDFSRMMPATVAKIIKRSTDPLLVETLCNAVDRDGINWHAKVRVLLLLPSAAWYFLPDKHDGVLHTVVAHLSDVRIDVQSTAKKALAGLCQSGLIGNIDGLIAKFKEDAKTKVRRVKRKRVNQVETRPENLPHTQGEKAALRRRLSGVLGLSALVLAHPYDEPDWMMDTLLFLVPYCHDIDVIRNAANETMSEFWRTHKETWHLTKEKLAQEEQDELRSVLISPSYYA